MAKKKQEKLNYAALCGELRENGPERLYLLCGEEDYLRESFIGELRKVCVEDGAADFCHHKLEAPELRAIGEAVDTPPFMSERSLVEVRGFDINRCREADAVELEKLCKSLPDYCTLAFVMSPGVEPDSRLKAVKLFAKYGKMVSFTAQEQGQLMRWIRRRFAALGKDCSPETAMRLIYTSGELMAGLIPEIEKVAAGTKAREIAPADVDRLAHRLPEASVFDMTDSLAERDFDRAAALLGELLASGEEPIRTLAMIGTQFRRLYAARLALDSGLGQSYLAEVCGIRFDFILRKLTSAARGFSLEQLAEAVRLCAATDYAMKSSSVEDSELLRELLCRIAAGCK